MINKVEVTLECTNKINTKPIFQVVKIIGHVAVWTNGRRYYVSDVMHEADAMNLALNSADYHVTTIPASFP